MSKFIGPSVVVPLHVRGRQLNPCSMDHDDELHKECRGWHMLRLLVQEGENVALIVGDEIEPSAEQRLSTQSQEEVGQDQRAEHLQGCYSPRWVTVFVSPIVIFKGYLVVKPPGLLLGRVFTVCNPTTNVGPVHRVCACITGTPPIGC